MRVFNKVEKRHLGFRHNTEFTQCTVCFELKRDIKLAANKEQRQSLINSYVEHVLMQWRGHQLYWSARHMRYQWFHTILQQLGAAVGWASISQQLCHSWRTAWTKPKLGFLARLCEVLTRQKPWTPGCGRDSTV